MRRMFTAIIGCAVLLISAGCTGSSPKVPTFSSDAKKLKVAASFYPIYEFTRAVGGDKVDLVNMVPPGTEPHDWEPSAGHIKTLNQADLLLYNGLGVDGWTSKALSSQDNKTLRSVELSKGFTVLKSDPHLWLDPQGAIYLVKAIEGALTAADNAHRADYAANAAAFISQLTVLDEEYKAGLRTCGQKEFFTSHAAFGYLANRYGLTQHAIMGLAPDAEPTPAALQAIVAEARTHGIKYIFFETLVSDKVAKVVAQEVGAQTLVLNPFEGLTDHEIKAGKNYVSVMRENLANLKTALECGK